MTTPQPGVGRHGRELRSRTSVHGGSPRLWCRALALASRCGLVLALLSALPAPAAKAGAHASTVSTSQGWKLACDAPRPTRVAVTTACALTVPLRGIIDGSRLSLVRRALQRRVTVQRALHRDVDVRIDVDSPGGELFAALEIGRLLRAEGASIAVGPGASCLSACVFLLMGALDRSISDDARVGIHRPSLGAPPAGGPGPGHEAAIVAAMAESLVLYAQQMHVSRRLIDAMMAIPPDRVELLSAAALTTYGIRTRETSARAERRPRAPVRR